MLANRGPAAGLAWEAIPALMQFPRSRPSGQSRLRAAGWRARGWASTRGDGGENGDGRWCHLSPVEILDSLDEFTEALKADQIESRLTVRRVRVDLAPTAYSADMVRGIRKRLGISQAVFGQVLGCSAKTVQAWEAGTAPTPDGMPVHGRDSAGSGVLAASVGGGGRAKPVMTQTSGAMPTALRGHAVCARHVADMPTQSRGHGTRKWAPQSS